jgi:hypothetical protein
VLCGDHHSPIQGPRGLTVTLRVAGLTNLLDEVIASPVYAACNLPAPQLCCGAYRLRFPLSYSCHLLAASQKAMAVDGSVDTCSASCYVRRKVNSLSF